MIHTLLTLRQLSGYCIVAYLLLNTPLGVFFLLQFPFIFKNKYCLGTWYVIDVMICHLCHGTGWKRTISGWTGQHMLTSKRYYYQSVVIDYLLDLLGDGENHCMRTYRSERKQGLVT